MLTSNSENKEVNNRNIIYAPNQQTELTLKDIDPYLC